MNELKKAWLAGIIDGEGCFTIFRKKTKSGRQFIYSLSANLTITNSCRALLEECRSILEEMQIKYTFLIPRNSTHRPMRRISIRNYGSIIKLLDGITPFLVGKKEHALLMQSFAIRASKRKGFQANRERELYAVRMKQLNHSWSLYPVETARGATHQEAFDESVIQSELAGDCKSLAEMPRPLLNITAA